MTLLSSHWWWDLSTREFSELDMGGIVAILPVGAVEQHGPHLPVKVDAAINAGIMARAVELMPPDFPALVLPMLPIGKSNEHLAYPGTLSLPYDLLARLWFEVAKSAWRAGVRKIILLNSHGGQPQVMEIVCRELRVELGMFAVGASWFRTIDSQRPLQRGRIEARHPWRRGRNLGDAASSSRSGADGASRTNFVPRSVAWRRRTRLLTPEGGVGFGWQAQDLHPAGACGNAAAGDAGRGAEQVERAARALIGLIEEVRDYPLDGGDGGRRRSTERCD